ncbi:MAG: SRPBCC family protein [Candidatus Eremiobacteraeota bacterium]|nr:SRPBCC family protein [Candidatus Eremiobacteraeota bacterium]MBV8263333.1 SRPBCC family protein [Candidatus Eremiobacteraeota bacterium]
MMTHQSITVQATPQTAYALAQDVSNWPQLLSHYAWVRVLDERDDERTLIMAAWRSWVLVRWTAVQRLLPAIPRIEFTHIGGWARGMRVAWLFDRTESGTKIEIMHDLATVGVPIVRTRLGKSIAARYFINPIASRTLAGMKRALESSNG